MSKGYDHCWVPSLAEIALVRVWVCPLISPHTHHALKYLFVNPFYHVFSREDQRPVHRQAQGRHCQVCRRWTAQGEGGSRLGDPQRVCRSVVCGQVALVAPGLGYFAGVLDEETLGALHASPDVGYASEDGVKTTTTTQGVSQIGRGSFSVDVPG